MELPLQDGAVAPKRRFQTSLRSVLRLWARVVEPNRDGGARAVFHRLGPDLARRVTQTLGARVARAWAQFRADSS